MASSLNSHFFIVSEDFEVSGGAVKGQKVLIGTLLKCTDDNVQKHVLLMKTMESNSILFEHRRDGITIKQINADYVGYLLGITNLGKRFKAFSNPIKLKKALEAKVDDPVKIPVRTDSGQCLASAVIRFKGNAGDGKDILFGLELTSHRGLGTSDGMFCRKRYFNCDDNSGMFVPFDKLSFDEPESANDDTMKAILDQFKIGTRVNIIDILISGKEQLITGVLRSIFPSQNSKDMLAGVELDEYMHCFDYSGTYGGYKYFKKQPNVTIFPLDCLVPSSLIGDDKSSKPKLIDQVKSMLPFDSKKEGSENTSPSFLETLIVGSRGIGKGKTKAQSKEEKQPFTTIDDGLLRKIAGIVNEQWLVMAELLGISKKKLDNISKNSSYYEEKAFQMLKIWQTKNEDMVDKLGVIAQICKSIGKEELCNELLQGVDDDILEFVAQEAYHQWVKLAELLGVPNVIEQLNKKHRSDSKGNCLEVLIIWRTNQPDVSDKLLFLASVLYQLDLGHVATFLTQGLDDEFLQQLSVGLSSSWQEVATRLGMTNKEITDIEYGANSDKAYQAFINWKKRQPSHFDKLGLLAQALKNSGHKELSNHLLGGIEDGEIHKLLVALRKIPVGTQTLCAALEFTKSHLKYFERKFPKNEFPQMKAMMLVWRAQQDRTKNKKDLLKTVFSGYGFTTIVRKIFPDQPVEERIRQTPSHDHSDEMEVDIDDASHVSDEVIAIISHDLLRVDVNALKVYFRIKTSSSTQHVDDLKSEAMELLMQLREVHKSSFKSVLTEGLDNVSRKDLANLLTGEPPSHGSIDSQPKQDDWEMIGTPPSELQQQLSIGTMVEVSFAGKAMYGLIRWIGYLSEMRDRGEIAGVELEEDCVAATDGTFRGKRFFQTSHRRALFIESSKCKPDRRFYSPIDHSGTVHRSDVEFVSPSVTEITLPPMASKPHPYNAMGIQGDQNSCYLDSTIFSMFAFVDVFDELLHRPRNAKDIEGYSEVQKVLKQDIVYPLRRNGFVKFESIRNLRSLLDKLGTTVGLRDQEKDPEEFLTTLLQEVLKSDPLFKIRVHGSPAAQEMNFYQMFMERDDTLKKMPTVQTLLEQSFLNTDIKLAEIPSCFVVQMPRFGKAYRLYERILPTLDLDITHMLENFPRPCVVCGRLSNLECKDCSSAKLGGEQITAYCKSCYERVHKKPDNKTHAMPRTLEVPEHFPRDLDEEQERKELHSEIMELFAVVCIETSHYVAFVKSGEDRDSKWLFFDSMADRMGDQDGFNIPKITELPKFQEWIENSTKYENVSNRQLEEPLRRLLCDAYMCFYRSPTVCH